MDFSIDKLYDRFLDSTGVSTDSRTITPGQIFFALSGPNFNGNVYVNQALEKGAILAVASDRSLEGERILVVPDPLGTLQDLARDHRDQLTIPVIGLTGSNGKTTSKELIRDVLASTYNVYATRGNLNNHIGVPLSVLGIPADADFAVIEMGANHQGEIALLSSICKPSHGLITNIGKAHLEGFGGIEGVKKGKSEIYHFLAKHGGKAFINVSEKFLLDLSGHVDTRITYGLFSVGDKSSGPSQVDFPFELQRVSPDIRINLPGSDKYLSCPLFGAYNAQNVATAIAVGLYFDVPLDAIRLALEAYSATDNRSQVLHTQGKKVVLDAYNANPTSMASAIKYFARSNTGSTAVIIGGMNELGESSMSEHQVLVDLLDSLTFDEVYVVGEHFQGLEMPGSFRHFTNTAMAIAYFTSNPLSADSVLLKGSRSNALESLVDHIH